MPTPNISRRGFLLAASAATIVAALELGGCASDSPSPPNTPFNSTTDSLPTHSALPTKAPAPAELSPSITLLNQAARSLIAHHEAVPAGWRFKSAIQAPHYQTDRDVGAASVGMGFLVMADYEPANTDWLAAAEQTAGWLTSIAKRDANGTSWPDYADDGDISADTYTPFDDGVLGVGDFYWELYSRTHKPEYKATAIASLKWTLAQAENEGTADTPVYKWRWNLNGSEDATYSLGMGMGTTGIVHTLATYYQRLRTTDPAIANQCKQYIDGGLRYISQVRSNLGNNDGDARAVPETGVIGQDGDTNMNSGYLSGAAGTAYMYLKLYDVFKDRQYLNEADKLFSWLEDTDNGPMVAFPDGSVAWKLALDPQGGDNTVFATGFEEGSAGIGWTYLQAYKITGNKRYLNVAQKAADWLAQTSVQTGNYAAWNEDESPANPIVHANLNNGAAGIGMFLKDLADTTKDTHYDKLSQRTLNWLIASAKHDAAGNVYWDDNDGDAPYSNDPSWHWGLAGIVAYAARMSGGKLDIPGEQASLR